MFDFDLAAALENMLDKKADEEIKLEAWKNRKQIGFKR
jgi:hypothetical protein